MSWRSLPPPLFYALLLPFWFYLSLRYRVSWSVFCLVNPRSPWGGLPFESKHRFHKDFPGLLAETLIQAAQPLENRMMQSRAFVAKAGFPVALKPDCGHRGLGVRAVRSMDELSNYLMRQRWDFILQEWDKSAKEYGLFYRHYPWEPKGRLTAVTEKEIPLLYGDGFHTIEELIRLQIKDNADALLTSAGLRKNTIPQLGESVRILDVASHNRGAQFRHRPDLLTPALEEALVQTCKEKGFYFGRLDVKAASDQDLGKGHFKIIEVNGATSENIHLWDAKTNLWRALLILFRQWKDLIRIGSYFRKNKKPPGTLAYLLRLWKYLNTSRAAEGRYW